MITVGVKVKNLDKLKSNFEKAPGLTLQYLAKATQASVFEVEKQAIDKNFQFKTPRAMRTGYLSLSFGYGRSFSTDGLRAGIGPTARYAPYVYFGTRRGTRPNPFMDRIAKAAEGAVGKQFVAAIEKLTQAIADV